MDRHLVLLVVDGLIGLIVGVWASQRLMVQVNAEGHGFGWYFLRMLGYGLVTAALCFLVSLAFARVGIL